MALGRVHCLVFCSVVEPCDRNTFLQSLFKYFRPCRSLCWRHVVSLGRGTVVLRVRIQLRPWTFTFLSHHSQPSYFRALPRAAHKHSLLKDHRIEQPREFWENDLRKREPNFFQAGDHLYFSLLLPSDVIHDRYFPGQEFESCLKQTCRPLFTYKWY